MSDAADAAARRRAKLLARGADRLAQLQQPIPTSAAASTTETETEAAAAPSAASEAVEPVGESLLTDSSSPGQAPGAPPSLASLLMGGGSAGNAALLAPERLETSVALKSLLICLLGAAVGWSGEAVLGGAALSWLCVLWLVSELSMRYAAQLLAPAAGPQPAVSQLGSVVTDLTSSVYAVCGRLCVFVFAVVVANDVRARTQE